MPQAAHTSPRLSNAQQLRRSVLLSFCDPRPSDYARLLHLSQRQWQDLLQWLHVSGLALYFLDRLRELGLVDLLPLPVLSSLEENLAENTERIAAMIQESAAIQREFQAAGLSYAVLKGFSLWPTSVPRLELRSQLDLDFLIAESNVAAARGILERFGYRLKAISGNTWEMKANEAHPGSLRTMYKAGQSRSAELHVETANGPRQLLAHVRRQCFHSVCMPILSPVDLFLGQALHAAKHICGEFSRAAHLIELRRHIIARFSDDAFWDQLEEKTLDQPFVRLRLGLVIALITRVMGPFAPEALTCWTAAQLPPAASLWVDLYGSRVVFADFPGTKLYLILQAELGAAGPPLRRSLLAALLPLCLPPAISAAVDGETLRARLHRQRRQLSFVFSRLRFHSIAGIRFLHESMLWRQHRNGLSQ